MSAVGFPSFCGVAADSLVIHCHDSHIQVFGLKICYMWIITILEKSKSLAPIDKLNILQGYDYGYGSKVPKTLWQHSNICQWRAPRNNHLPSQTQNAKQNVVTNISNNISTVFLWILCQLSGSSLEKKSCNE